MTDEERHRVGIRYKEAGQQAAIELGFELVGPGLSMRIAAWRTVCEAGPAAVACWRGGLRSKLTCDFIDRPGVVRVEGGYKAIRAYLVAQMARRTPTMSPVVIAGLTGSGKTALLKQIGTSGNDILALDLEEAANHRGSAFGRRGAEQPAQASFENRLALELTLTPARWLLLEDESRNIGRRQLPDPIMDAIRQGPLLLVDEPLESRIRQIHQDYVQGLSDALGVGAARQYFEAGLMRLKKRLSNDQLETCLRALEKAARSGSWRDSEAHESWIRILLEHYYDPLYRKSLDKHQRPVLFSGSRKECDQWMKAWMTESTRPFA